MESGKNQISEGVEEQGSADSVAFGDVIYIKLRSGSWWPAQVVDDEGVDGSIKPAHHCTGDVLVRLYGSYTYSYVNPIRSCAEFEMTLKNNNGDLRKILEEAFLKDLPSTKKSSSKTKGKPSKTSASKRKSSPQDEKKAKTPKQSKDGDLGSQSRETASGKPQELSSRRIRVMESLGLIAPPGSPFLRPGKHA